jgi:tetratricopeptide (TPR) repeat protein
MSRAIPWAGIVVTVVVSVGIVWLYATQPRSISELRTNVAVQTNLYEVDRVQFDLGRAAFREKQFRIAIERFSRADAAARDPQTQFLIAASHYELGRGRVYDDDTEFTAALAAVDRCLANAPDHTYTLVDPSLSLPYTSAERLRERLREGLTSTAGDLNPFGGGAEEHPR